MLPTEIYITQEHAEGGEGWYAVSTNEVDAVSDSENERPVVVGKYKLITEQAFEIVRTVKVQKAKAKKS